MITLQGTGASAGIAIGRIVFHEKANLKIEKKPVTDVAGEIERFFDARLVAIEELDELAITMVEKIGEENAMLFEIHRSDA